MTSSTNVSRFSIHSRKVSRIRNQCAKFGSSFEFLILDFNSKTKIQLRKPHFRQFILQRGLKFLNVRRRRFVTLLRGDNAEPSGLVQIPIRILSVAERNLAAD